MKKILIVLVLVGMLCFSMPGAVGTNKISKNIDQKETSYELPTFKSYNAEEQFNEEYLIEKYSKYITDEKTITTTSDEKEIELPWINEGSNLLEWWIRIKYKGETFQKEVPVDITDFKDKFLKHPEYGEILNFDIDSDPENDVQVIVGFYWEIIKQPDGSEVKSLEKRFRVRLLESGNYLEDSDAEFEVWSELHVNYGLFKHSNSKQKALAVSPVFSRLFKLEENTFFHKFLERFNFFRNLLNLFKNRFKNSYMENVAQGSEQKIDTLIDDGDYIAVGAGYRSPEGNDIPRYTEKRYSFAREKIFSPTIFQHKMDPGSSKGKGPFEILYGFQAYKSGASSPSYDIAFSIEFDPAVYLKTKFIPRDGYVYYYYEDSSETYKETKVTFAADIVTGAGPNDEGVQLSLIFDEIDDSLARSGRWMSFDIEVLGDNDPLAGKFSYQASDKFSVGVVVDSPAFEEKVEIVNIPTSVDVAWDLDFTLRLSPFKAHADGFVDLTMNSDLGGINVYYPKTDPDAQDVIFIDVPGGVPRSAKIEAAATLDLGSSYFYGKLKHDCSSNFQCIRAFLPEETVPIVKVTEIPSYSEAKARLNWNNLEGYAYLWRSSSGPKDPIEINLEYAGYQVYDHLEIRNGHIETSFKAANDGYFNFDTSQRMLSNTLEVSSASGEFLNLYVDEVSADDLQTDWDITSSGGKLQINDLHFSGIIDTLKGLELNLDFQGKTADLNLDWVMGDQGNFEIGLAQQNDLTLDFNDLFPEETDAYVMDGSVTLSQNLGFDMEWNFWMGENKNGNVDPGFFRINKEHDSANIKNFDLYFTVKNSAGEEAYGVDAYFVNPRIYLDVSWYFDTDDIFPPYVYIWLDYEFQADSKDVDILWTDLWPGSDDYGEHHWIDVV